MDFYRFKRRLKCSMLAGGGQSFSYLVGERRVCSGPYHHNHVAAFEGFMEGTPITSHFEYATRQIIKISRSMLKLVAAGVSY